MGERAQARWWSRGKAEWQFGYIIKKLGRLHYEVRLDSGYMLKRHINQLRSTDVKIHTPIEERQKKKVTFADEIHTLPTRLDLDLIYNNNQPNGVQDQEAAEDVTVALPEPEDNEPDIRPAELTPIRRSERARKPPAHLRDYVK